MKECDPQGAPRRHEEASVDCEHGRRLGCATFCCRLIVRLRPGEPHPTHPSELRSCIDKDPETGLCVHLDPDTHRCGIWERRPQICRAYDCNQDPSLQVVLRDGFRSLTQIAWGEPPPRSQLRRVPLL